MFSRTTSFPAAPLTALTVVLAFLAASLTLLLPSRVRAQSSRPALIGAWTLQAATYGYDNAGDPGSSPQFEALPTGLCIMRITDQNGRVFAGRIVCGGEESSAQLLTGAILPGGEIQMLVAEDLDSRSWCFAKLSADGDSLVIHGAVSSMEDPAVAKEPGFATSVFTARLVSQ